MTRICEVFESLKLKIITANATVLSGMIKKTVVIEVRLPSLSLISPSHTNVKPKI
jgi:hypothetical protein